ncbi:HTH domain-containing protein [archaeon]|nr:HTH domain-containing protein [archaeon]
MLDAIKDKRFTSRFFAKEIGVNRSTVESDLNELKKEGFIGFTGSASGGYWEVLR